KVVDDSRIGLVGAERFQSSISMLYWYGGAWAESPTDPVASVRPSGENASAVGSVFSVGVNGGRRGSGIFHRFTTKLPYSRDPVFSVMASVRPFGENNGGLPVRYLAGWSDPICVGWLRSWKSQSVQLPLMSPAGPPTTSVRPSGETAGVAD